MKQGNNATPCDCGAEWWKAAGYCDRCGAEIPPAPVRWHDDPRRGSAVLWALYAVIVAMIWAGV